MSIYRIFTFDKNENIISEVSEHADNEKEVIKSIENKFTLLKNKFVFIISF